MSSGMVTPWPAPPGGPFCAVAAAAITISKYAAALILSKTCRCSQNSTFSIPFKVNVQRV